MPHCNNGLFLLECLSVVLSPLSTFAETNQIAKTGNFSQVFHGKYEGKPKDGV